MLSYRRDTRNRAFFVSSGSDFSLSTEFSTGDLDYYIFRARYAHFFPLGQATTFKLSSRLDYGDDSMPFFRNFYMSGSATMRGFDSGSLGAKEICIVSNMVSMSRVIVPGLSAGTCGYLIVLNCICRFLAPKIATISVFQCSWIGVILSSTPIVNIQK